MTLPDGLPNRPWFRHQIYAPGFYTGYGVKTIPGVPRQSSRRSGNRPTSRSCVPARCCRNEAKVIEEAAAALESAVK